MEQKIRFRIIYVSALSALVCAALIFAFAENASPGVYFAAVLLAALAGAAISFLAARRLTRSLVRPLNELAENIDELEGEAPYEELRPFILSIRESQLQKLENEKVRQEFTANVSHELKTPLTSISGYAEMIETGIARDEDIKGFAEKIRNEAGRLITLIGDIIMLSELDSPGANRDFERTDLLEPAKTAAELLAFNAEKAGISLTVAGSSCEVWGDAGMLEELVYNLCDNAIRYNRPGGSVKVGVFAEGDAVKLSVEDSGIGIPREHQSRIFERFYRIDKSRSKETGGTGLGLAIVKHIALQHGAKISVLSEVGQGTRVDVLFKQAR